MANTPKDKAPADAAAASKKPAKAPKPAPEPKSATRQSPADRIQALEAEIARIKRDEYDSRYNLIVSAIDELNGMGYQFRLVDDSKGAARGAKKTAPPPSAEPPAVSSLSAHYDEKKYCKLCKEGGHDQKAHTRAGDFQNKPFTNEEKARRGVLPPELEESFKAEQQAARD